MKNIKLDSGDILISDPCYIKGVFGEYGGRKEWRYDGCFEVKNRGEVLGDLGVDSGRIWAMVAEFPCEVEIHSGFSGHILIRNKSDYSHQKQAVEKVLGGLEV